MEIKTYPGQIIINKGENTEELTDLGYQAGRYTRQEWIDSFPSWLEETEKEELLWHLELTSNIDFFDKDENYPHPDN